MILALDMGNTNIVVGCIDSEKTYFVERLTTNHNKTSTEYAINIKNILEIHGIHTDDIEGAILSSVVPPLNAAISSAVKKILGHHAGWLRHQNRHEYSYGQSENRRQRSDCGRCRCDSGLSLPHHYH